MATGSEQVRPTTAAKAWHERLHEGTAALFPVYLHPLLAFGGIWLLICLLYSFRLSALILYSGEDVFRLVTTLLVVFTAGIAISWLLPGKLLMPKGWRLKSFDRTESLLDRRLRFWFRLWCIVTCFEIIFSKGIPAVWLVTGNPKTYMDFGIPTVHGFLNSLLLSICLTRVGMALRFGRKKDFLYFGWAVCWSVIVVTRQLMMVYLLEAAVVYCTYRLVRVRRILGGISAVLGLVYVFGVVGDFRTGAENFRTLAQPTASYPDWLPSGVLWFYMYLSTPVNNLLYTFHSTHPIYDARFPNTLAQIFPTVLRKLIFSANQLEASNGDLVTQAFNVSTAFAGPFEDYGLAGVLLMVLCMSVLSGLYWRKRSFRDRLCYSVLCQCLLLTVFFNHFVLLPVITQLVWIYVLFYRTEGNISSDAATA